MSNSNELPALPLCPPAQRYTYHVISSAAPMPSSCWGVYKRIGVIEVDHHERPLGYVPTRIVELRGCRVIETWEKLNVGKTDACAYAVALREAKELAQLSAAVQACAAA